MKVRFYLGRIHYFNILKALFFSDGNHQSGYQIAEVEAFHLKQNQTVSFALKKDETRKRLD